MQTFCTNCLNIISDTINCTAFINYDLKHCDITFFKKKMEFSEASGTIFSGNHK